MIRRHRSWKPRARASQSGQALIETALTIPVLFFLVIGFYEVALVVESNLDLQTAVGLAAAASATAPANDAHDATEYAQLTFQNTVKHFSLLAQPSLTCQGPYAAGDTITCTGQATFTLAGTLFPGALTLGLSATSHAHISAYRAQAPPGG